ncbi:MAG TPA: M1 family aminopeptidase [Thermoanaerobaculia bacterium]|nr:M1 family aminopeptidase [Thermoanaerobaculia bacterium]
MRRVLVFLVLVCCPANAQVVPGHRLPEGPERPARERQFDISKYRADLQFDVAHELISGTAVIDLAALRTGLSTITLDAAGLEVRNVTVAGTPAKFSEDSKARTLDVALPRAFEAGETTSIAVTYSVRPKTGMYFFPATRSRSAQAWNYGEGGLHYGWLPIYNDTNDKFAVELVVTVPKPYTALANGVLAETKENPNGTRTFRWVQEKPIPNYLMTVDVGDFARVPIGEAKLPTGVSVPLTAWTPPGTEAKAALAFRDTPKMVEFYSQLFGYVYPWAKYDQVALTEFAVGAMETTTMTGFSESHLKSPNDPPDATPAWDEAYPTWTYEDTVAHELAHHWFGDLVTCRSLGSIWLNESFASFCHTIWNGHAHGEDDLTYQRWRYLNKYLDYVHGTGTVRPLEFFRYKSPSAMYQTETTYLKGSLVLHMLRHFVGDADFYRTLSDYLRAHEFGNADSEDLQKAFQMSCGRDLSWFFGDWVSGGGGHPTFEVSYRWVPERKQVDLTVKQVQADLPFENDFRLPVDVEVVTRSGARRHRVELAAWSTSVALSSNDKPERVVFDKGGWLVAEVKFERPFAEIAKELAEGELAERLRAARQLASDFGRREETATALSRILADPKTYWGLRQEAALDLGTCGGEVAVAALERALADPDRRLRRAAALALGRAGGHRAAAALERTISGDRAEDVVGAAELALGRIGGAGARAVLERQLARESSYWDAIRLGALLGLSELRDPSLAPTFEKFVTVGYVQDVRSAALTGWVRAAPDDPKLAAALRTLARDRNRHIRETALERLASLHHATDAMLLRTLAESDPDPNVAAIAKEGLEEIGSFLKK